MAAVWGWDDGVQRDLHARGFDPARTRIVTVDGRDLGVLIVEHRPEEIVLGRIRAPGPCTNASDFARSDGPESRCGCDIEDYR